MSEFDYSKVPVESLESLRNRLNQVHLSLRKLADQVNHNIRNPNKAKLPNYAQFQNQFHVLITQLQSIASILTNDDDILKRTNAYPLPNFPTTEQEALVTTLLRKKPLPEVEGWMKDAIGRGALQETDLEKDEAFVKWCAETVQDLRDEFQFYGFHSQQELAFLETEEGKREAQRKRDLELEQEEEKMRTTGGKQPLHPNKVLKFMYQGVLDDS